MPRLFVCLRCTFLFFREGFSCCRQQRFAASCWAGGKLCRDSAVSLDDVVLWYDGRCLTDGWVPLLNVTHKTHLFTFASIYLSIYMYRVFFIVSCQLYSWSNLKLSTLRTFSTRSETTVSKTRFGVHLTLRCAVPGVRGRERRGMSACVHTFALPASLSEQIELSYHSQPIPCSVLRQPLSVCVFACGPRFVFVEFMGWGLPGLTDLPWSGHVSTFGLKHSGPREWSESVIVRLSRAV